MPEPAHSRPTQALPKKTVEAVLRSLGSLISSAEKEGQEWNDLRHFLLKFDPGETEESLRLAEFMAEFGRPNVHALPPEPPMLRFGHVFQGLTYSPEIKEAWKRLVFLSQAAVRVLEGVGRMPLYEMPPEFDGPGYRNRWPCRLMEHAHHFASRNRPGSLLRADPVHKLNEQELPGSVVAWQLSPGIFKAVALALEMEVEEILEQSDLGLNDRNEAPAPSGKELPATSKGFPCSKAELLRALGKHETHLNYLSQLVEAGNLLLAKAEKPIGHSRYFASFSDSNEHAKIFKAIIDDRKN